MKAGTTLGRAAMARLVAALSECEVSWACAHGRPTAMPLAAWDS